MLVGRFVTEFYRLVAEWSDWATSLVEAWPEEVSDAVPDPEALAETVRRATWGEPEA